MSDKPDAPVRPGRRIEWSKLDDPETFAPGADAFSLAALDALDPYFDETREALRKLMADLYAADRDAEQRRRNREACESGIGCDAMPFLCPACRRCLGHCECR